MGQTENHNPRGPHHAQTDTDTDTDSREKSFSRRAILHAGWTVPVVMAVAPSQAAIPPSGLHGDAHIDCANTPEDPCIPPYGPRNDS